MSQNLKTINKRISDFQNAKFAKKDEFYTQIQDIQKEVEFYKKSFKNKVVYLNCDDPRHSNFFRYFVENFKTLDIKSLIVSGFSVINTDENFTERGVWFEYKGDTNIDFNNLRELEVNYFKGDGDFRSDESMFLLKRSDIVVTNPPFSLFKEYISQLVLYQKQFLILGNMNALTYKEVFPLFQTNALRYGKSIRSGDREFEVPTDYPLEATGTRIDSNGTRYIRVKGVRWFTNLPADVKLELIPLNRNYNKDLYPTYVNFPAIEVGKTADIPSDYTGLMGVPISFMDRYNPEQFEIVGNSKTLAQPMSKFAPAGSYQSGGLRFYIQLADGSFKRMYERIIIKNRQLKES